MNGVLTHPKQVYYTTDGGAAASYYWEVPQADQVKTLFYYFSMSSVGTNCKASLVMEWTLDGINWSPGETLVNGATVAGTNFGTTANQFAPRSRLNLKIEATTGSAQVHATCEVWAAAKPF